MVLLDDCLAAVDAKVAAWILRHALLGPLLWGPPLHSGTGEHQNEQQGEQHIVQQQPQPQPPPLQQQPHRQRTVVIATHSAELLAAADLVVEMHGGTIVAVRQQEGAAQRRALAAAQVAAAAAEGGGSEGAPPSRAAIEREPAAAAGRALECDSVQQPEQAQQAQQAEEERQTGHVRWAVYRRYAAATGWGWVTLILGSLLLMQVRGAAVGRCQAGLRRAHGCGARLHRLPRFNLLDLQSCSQPSHSAARMCCAHKPCRPPAMATTCG